MAMQCLFRSTIDDEWRHWLFHNRLLSFMFGYLDKLPPTKVHIFWYSSTAKPFCFFADMFGEIIHALKGRISWTLAPQEQAWILAPQKYRSPRTEAPSLARFALHVMWRARSVIGSKSLSKMTLKNGHATTDFVYLQRDAHLPFSELNTTTGSLFLFIRSHRILILQWREYCFIEHVASHFTLFILSHFQ
jgi:hypothetical protein